MNAIEIDSLTKTFVRRGSPPVKAVVDLSLSIPPGQIFGFLGPNGAGKTTTIKMMCSVVTPNSGTVKLNGHDVQRDRSNAMRQIGAVLEGTRSIYWRFSALENLMYFGRLKGVRSRDLKPRAERLLSEIDLWDRRKDDVKNFSRGMQQKVAISAALMSDPPIVLLDEPTLGLDVESSRTVREWVTQLAKKENKTVLLTTHQLAMAEELCDRVAIINEGHLIADRSVSDLLGLFRRDFYRIRVGGHLREGHTLAAGLSFAESESETIISGDIVEQDRLHEVLRGIQEQGLPLLSVERSEPDLEEVFVKLLEEDRQ
jgi:ABC-2 type transport system ATP-binding protein